MKCNLCGCQEFVDVRQRIKSKCKQCGSKERTRLLWLYLQTIPIDSSTKILHLAPERSLYACLGKLTNENNYVCADIDPRRYRFARNVRMIDLCSLDSWPSLEFDIIIHSHVLEHVRCNIAHSLFHLHRMLKASGLHICIIPISSGKYEENFEDLSDAERTTRFGQPDHFRRIGREDIGSHLGTLLALPAEFDATKTFSEDELTEANIPEQFWRGFHMSTVLMLKRGDMKLLQ